MRTPSWVAPAVAATNGLLYPVVLTRVPSGWQLVCGGDNDAHGFPDSLLWTVSEAKTAADEWLAGEDIARFKEWSDVSPGVLSTRCHNAGGARCGGCGRVTPVGMLVFTIGTDSTPLLRVEACTSGACVEVVIGWVRACVVQFRGALSDAGVAVSEY